MESPGRIARASGTRLIRVIARWRETALGCAERREKPKELRASEENY